MKQKLYKCNECGIEVKIRSKGLCSFCRFKIRGSQTKIYFIKQQTEKNKQKKRNKTELMKTYWSYHLEQLKKGKICQNCDNELYSSIIFIAHILPKRRHTSVMDNLNNCLYLCAKCHNRFDNTQGSSKVYLMNVFPIALKKYLTFKNEVLEYSKYKEIFDDYIINEENS